MIATEDTRSDFDGHCVSFSNGTYKIFIKEFLLNENVNLSYLRNTIMHELLHTCWGCHGHTKIFLRHAKKIMSASGGEYNVLCVTTDWSLRQNNQQAAFVYTCDCGYTFSAKKGDPALQKWTEILNHADNHFCQYCKEKIQKNHAKYYDVH